MKCALIIPDGCADEPCPELGGRTPLQAARVPAMDRIARCGVVGLADNTPRDFPSGSDVATMCLLGYDPHRYHTGRAPIEAAAQGIALGPDDWAVRCNLVTIHDGIMVSFTADQIPSPMARRLMDLLQREAGAERWEFHPGVSYRNLAVYRGAPGEPPPFTAATRTTPPHDLTDGPIERGLPTGPGADRLEALRARSRDLCSRREFIDSAATEIWLWGQGQRPAFPEFASRYGRTAAFITAVDLLRGLARLVGARVIDVPGATGYLDTDYAAKGRYAAAALDESDFVVVHVEATDEASHEGNAAAKVEALERIDEKIVGPLFERLQREPAFRILVSPDHPTFVRTKTHGHGWVPFAACGTGIAPAGAAAYDEAEAARAGFRFDRGWELMPQFLGGAAFPLG